MAHLVRARIRNRIMELTYEQFIDQKRQLGGNYGFKSVYNPSFPFDFQKYLIDFSLLRGRAAIFADCGTGKSIMEMVVGQNVVEHTNKSFLIITPLAVSWQMEREGNKFGVEIIKCRDGKIGKVGIYVTNYENLHKFNPYDFGGACCDESGILKNYDGKFKAQIVEFMRKMKYRFLYTATAAPNDYPELGNSSEALGELSYMDMLARFFKAEDGSNRNTQGGGRGIGGMARFNNNPFDGKFRFRGHAERDFWRWVCSWARALRKPSDVGFEDKGFILPKLTVEQHIIKAKSLNDGKYLFDIVVPVNGLAEERAEGRRTIQERCEKAAELISIHKGPTVAWCHLNPEGDLLEELIKDSVQVSGSDSDDKKEEALIAFQKGEIKDLVTKGKIAGFGQNWQHCAYQTMFPSHSFEMYYQCIRRSWRFGQKNPVKIDIISSEGESKVLANLQRKERAAEEMFKQLVNLMNNELKIERKTETIKPTELPKWLLPKKYKKTLRCITATAMPA